MREFYVPMYKDELINRLRKLFPAEHKSFFIKKGKKQLYAIFYHKMNGHNQQEGFNVKS